MLLPAEESLAAPDAQLLGSAHYDLDGSEPELGEYTPFPSSHPSGEQPVAPLTLSTAAAVGSLLTRCAVAAVAKARLPGVGGPPLCTPHEFTSRVTRALELAGATKGPKARDHQSLSIAAFISSFSLPLSISRQSVDAITSPCR